MCYWCTGSRHVAGPPSDMFFTALLHTTAGYFLLHKVAATYCMPHGATGGVGRVADHRACGSGGGVNDNSHLVPYFLAAPGGVRGVCCPWTRMLRSGRLSLCCKCATCHRPIHCYCERAYVLLTPPLNNLIT